VIARQSFVFDSFALIALFRDEAGAPRVREILEQARAGNCDIVLSVVNLAEVVYTNVRRHGVAGGASVAAAVRALPVHVVPADIDLSVAAGHLKGEHPVSLADCYAVALASQTGGTVVTGDPDFQRFASVVSVEWLPR
jgi:ribonuclease VapC